MALPHMLCPLPGCTNPVMGTFHPRMEGLAPLGFGEESKSAQRCHLLGEWAGLCPGRAACFGREVGHEGSLLLWDMTKCRRETEEPERGGGGLWQGTPRVPPPYTPLPAPPPPVPRGWSSGLSVAPSVSLPPAGGGRWLRGLLYHCWREPDHVSCFQQVLQP